MIGIAAVIICGCTSTCGASSDQEGAVANGELGNGVFRYACNSCSDSSCVIDEFDTWFGGCTANVFPDCIAAGGRFQLDYELRDDDALVEDDPTPFLRVDSGNDDFYFGTDSFQARRLGRAVLLAREDDHVLDMIHIPIAIPTEMAILSSSGEELPSGPIELEVGQLLTIRAIPRGTTACPRLGGALDVAASAEDTAIIDVVADEQIDIMGEAEGSTTLTIGLGDLTRDLTVVVSPSSTTSFGTSTTDPTETDTDVTATDTDPTETDTDVTATDTDPTGTDTDATGTDTDPTGSSTGGGT